MACWFFPCCLVLFLAIGTQCYQASASNVGSAQDVVEGTLGQKLAEADNIARSIASKLHDNPLKPPTSTPPPSTIPLVNGCVPGARVGGPSDLIINGCFIPPGAAPGWVVEDVSSNTYTNPLDSYDFNGSLPAAGLPPPYSGINSTLVYGMFIDAYEGLANVSQLVNGTQPGVAYTFSFYVGDANFPYPDQNHNSDKLLEVYVDEAIVPFTSTYTTSVNATALPVSLPCPAPGCPYFDVFSHFSTKITPTSTSTPIRFSGENGLVLTLVSLVPA